MEIEINRLVDMSKTNADLCESGDNGYLLSLIYFCRGFSGGFAAIYFFVPIIRIFVCSIITAVKEHRKRQLSNIKLNKIKYSSSSIIKSAENN